MNPLVLNKEIQEFINKNLDSELTALVLKGTPFTHIETKEIVDQIESKNRCQKKLPTWFYHPNIYYPNKINVEQTSSETTAEYKSVLIRGNSIIDLTGGFGVDCLYFAKRFKLVTHCEINEELSEIVTYNFNQFGIKNIETIPNDGIQFLKSTKKFYDWIYLDPSRRHSHKGKVFFLKDCTPNVVNEFDVLFEHSTNILIKTSPLLDISIGISELKYVKFIHVVAVNNEVKELLWILEKEYKEPIEINTINIKSENNEIFNFFLDNESIANADLSLPLSYIYEPNSAILKAGAFNSVSERLRLFKLHKHSHLYTSENLIDFPGRRFKVESVIPYQKKQLKQLGIQKANITTRNFPETVQNIREALKIKDGGSTYLFFTVNALNEKIVIVSSKIS